MWTINMIQRCSSPGKPECYIIRQVTSNKAGRASPRVQGWNLICAWELNSQALPKFKDRCHRGELTLRMDSLSFALWSWLKVHRTLCVKHDIYWTGFARVNTKTSFRKYDTNRNAFNCECIQQQCSSNLIHLPLITSQQPPINQYLTTSPEACSYSI